MADNNNPQIPDLASVLRTLASLAPANPQQPGQDIAASLLQHHPEPPYHPTHPTQANLQPPPNVEQIPSRPTSTIQDQRTVPQHRPSVQDPPRAGSTPPLIDPATITEWSHGLRCITKIAGQTPNFKVAIRKMMADQEHQEKTWQAEREALLKAHAARSDNDENLKSILSSLGTSLDAEPVSAEQAEIELKQLDKRIYRAVRLMVDNMSLELKRLGVPFFGVKPELILPPGEAKPAGTPPPAASSVGPKITEEELLALQRRMVEYLEDMYRL
ncbi:uncharacterized protein BDZ99DRAFT_459613 [Mytilinidion resinicola]|uniref:Uncharacterized protein n=1 Tax=Mytilinidion resinicola TaxID=574789 RepID=A0A6A6YY60_9PEZI|nr:uncharacterized protein BDZ99DRAFT_459613 [Mytilinidion resinicola]KAF2813862.1 hypothetical protein BDZ99DRAFT_459613 [Mytilinidion resinicola]